MRFILFNYILFSLSLCSLERQEKNNLHYATDISFPHPLETLGRNNEFSTPCYYFVKKAEKYLREFENQSIFDFELIRCFDRNEKVVVSLMEYAPVTKEQIEAAKINKTQLPYRHGSALELEISKNNSSVLSLIRIR